MGCSKIPDLMQIRNGSTRTVFLTRNYAVKIPTLLFTGLWNRGRIANLHERRLSGIHKDLCPVVWGDPFGLILVMPKVGEISSSIDWLDMRQSFEFRYKNDPMCDFLLRDFKPSNWGVLNGRLVKIDYGN